MNLYFANVQNYLWYVGSYKSEKILLILLYKDIGINHY